MPLPPSPHRNPSARFRRERGQSKRRGRKLSVHGPSYTPASVIGVSRTLAPCDRSTRFSAIYPRVRTCRRRWSSRPSRPFFSISAWSSQKLPRPDAAFTVAGRSTGIGRPVHPQGDRGPIRRRPSAGRGRRTTGFLRRPGRTARGATRSHRLSRCDDGPAVEPSAKHRGVRLRVFGFDAGRIGGPA